MYYIRCSNALIVNIGYYTTFSLHLVDKSWIFGRNLVGFKYVFGKFTRKYPWKIITFFKIKKMILITQTATTIYSITIRKCTLFINRFFQAILKIFFPRLGELVKAHIISQEVEACFIIFKTQLITFMSWKTLKKIAPKTFIHIKLA